MRKSIFLCLINIKYLIQKWQTRESGKLGSAKSTKGIV